jgi:hypothetical protein
MTIFNMNNDALLRYVIGTAYACNTMHNIFLYNDEDEVANVMEDRNDVKALLDLVVDDPATCYAGHNSARDVLNRMKVTDLIPFISSMYSTLDDLIVSEDYDDEDDMNESDYANDDMDDSENDETDESDDDDEDSDDEDESDDEVSVDDFPTDDEFSAIDNDDIESLFDALNAGDETSDTDDTRPIIYRRS